jgi:5-methyltetrahydropteroyltriglutamate--homocysteine methyltransferase
MIERCSKQRLDFRDKTGGGGEALPGVVARLVIPNLKHRIAIGTVELLEDAVAQNARTIGIACRGTVVEQFVLPARNGGLPEAIGEVKYLDAGAIADECRHFRDVLAEKPGVFAEPFMSAPSPGIVAMAVRNEYYDTLESYLAALGAALQTEYEAIVKHGFLLQIDAPDLALERHITFKDRPVAAFVGFVEEVVATINCAIRDVPRERVRLHVCWGNSESPHDCDVPLEDILPVLLKADVGGLVLPFANPRHAHEFRCFEKFPLADDQVLVAGVIDSLTNFVEHPEVVADRLERVAAVIGDPARVLAGTDCGFDTSAGWGRVAEDVVWAKLASLRDGARLASQRLFG